MYYVEHNAFPGVNPYIEAEGYWPDFHSTFIVTLREAVLKVLPRAYDIRIDQDIVLREPLRDDGRSTKPDVAVIERRGARERHGVPSAAAGTGTLEGIDVEMEGLEEVRHVWAEVRRLENDDLVTSIELMSPTNKSGADAAVFREKRLRLLRSGVNLVDLDLLKQGQRLRFSSPLPAGDFYAFVTRRTRLPNVSVFAWSLRDPLPSIPIPLEPGDAEVRVDLAAVYQSTFDRSGFPRRLQYHEPLPAFGGGDDEWSRALVQAAATS